MVSDIHLNMNLNYWVDVLRLIMLSYMFGMRLEEFGMMI